MHFRYSIILSIHLICVGTIEISAQYGDATQMDILKAISSYRTDLMSYDTEETAKVGVILKQFKESGLTYDQISNVISSMRYTRMSEFFDYSSVRTYLAKEFPENAFLKEIQDEYIDIIVTNADIIDLINFDVVDIEYPFPVLIDSLFFKELEFIQIQKNDRIGEIGAGDGTFSTLVSCIYSGVSIFINEITEEKSKVILQKLLHCNSIKKSSWVEVVQGKNSNTSLEGKELNKIIIRNAFHEFSKKEKMLKSIWNSLTSDGVLFLQEWDKSYYPEDYQLGCEFYMTRKEIQSVLKENGFLLSDIFQEKGFLLMKFEKNPNYKP